MVRLNKENVKMKLHSLQHFEGFLPFQFNTHINRSKRKEFLIQRGLWDRVHKQDLKVMQGIRDTRPNDDVYMDRVLLKWVEDNPQFRDLIIVE